MKEGVKIRVQGVNAADDSLVVTEISLVRPGFLEV
jgi:hypothetical protein